MSEYYLTQNDLYLAHHGIKGQKWGVRNYQNPDGTLTAEGRIRYGYGAGLDKISSSGAKLASDSRSAARIRKYGRIGSSIANRVGTAANTAQRNAESLKKIHESDASTFKKVLKSASYMAVPTLRSVTDPTTGDTSKYLNILKGSGFKANENKALADQARTSESYRSTKTGRYLASIAAKNYDSFAKYYENRAESDSVKEYLKNTLKIFNTPTTRLTGKQTTVGREAVRLLLTAGIAQGIDLGRVVVGREGVRKYDDSAYKQARKDAKSRKNEIRDNR